MPDASRELLHGTYTAIATCLYVFDYTEDDKKEIMQVVMETKDLF